MSVPAGSTAVILLIKNDASCSSGGSGRPFSVWDFEGGAFIVNNLLDGIRTARLSSAQNKLPNKMQTNGLTILHNIDYPA